MAAGVVLFVWMFTTRTIVWRDLGINLLASIAIAIPTVFVFQRILAQREEERRRRLRRRRLVRRSALRKVLNFQALNLVLSDVEYVGLAAKKPSTWWPKLTAHLPEMRRRARDVSGKAYTFSGVLPFEVSIRLLGIASFLEQVVEFDWNSQPRDTDHFNTLAKMILGSVLRIGELTDDPKLVERVEEVATALRVTPDVGTIYSYELWDAEARTWARRLHRDATSAASTS